MTSCNRNVKNLLGSLEACGEDLRIGTGDLENLSDIRYRADAVGTQIL